MKSRIHIGLRAALYCFLVLSVLLVPLAHSAHFHGGDEDGDASVSATCVVCHSAESHHADCARSVDLTAVARQETGFAVAVPTAARSLLLTTEASRAPPYSLS